MKKVREKYLNDTGNNMDYLMACFHHKADKIISDYIIYLEDTVDDQIRKQEENKQQKDAKVKMDKMGQLLFLKRIQHLMSIPELDNYDRYVTFLENIHPENYQTFLALYETNDMEWMYQNFIN